MQTTAIFYNFTAVYRFHLYGGTATIFTLLDFLLLTFTLRTRVTPPPHTH